MYASIIISTYNRPDALMCVLESLNEQHCMKFEVIVADDGSMDETKIAIDKFREKTKFPLQHVWQEDAGFRVAKIRNKAVAVSEGEYLIFIDGDCVTFPDFIENHFRLAEKNYFTRGSRVMLSELFTNEFIQAKTMPSSLTMFKAFSLWKSKKVNRILPLITMPLGFLRKQKLKKWYGVKTCNLGLWRDDFVEVNGFDEEYVGWGHEDADLTIRLIKSGVYRKEGVNAVTVLHLWHPLSDRSNLKDNEQRLKLRISSNATRIKYGVSQYKH